MQRGTHNSIHLRSPIFLLHLTLSTAICAWAEIHLRFQSTARVEGGIPEEHQPRWWRLALEYLLSCIIDFLLKKLHLLFVVGHSLFSRTRTQKIKCEPAPPLPVEHKGPSFQSHDRNTTEIHTHASIPSLQVWSNWDKTMCHDFYHHNTFFKQNAIMMIAW